MKKIATLLIILFLISNLHGCTLPNEPSTDGGTEEVTQNTDQETQSTEKETETTENIYIKPYVDEMKFYLPPNSNCYSLIFLLYDQNGRSVAVDATANLWIEDENGYIFYSKTISLSKTDFDNYPMLVTVYKNKHYCWLEIPIEDVPKATSKSGTVYLDLYDMDFEVDTASCPATDCFSLISAYARFADHKPYIIDNTDEYLETRALFYIDYLTYDFKQKNPPAIDMYIYITKTVENRSSEINLKYNRVEYQITDRLKNVRYTGVLDLSELKKNERTKIHLISIPIIGNYEEFYVSFTNPDLSCDEFEDMEPEITEPFDDPGEMIDTSNYVKPIKDELSPEEQRFADHYYIVMKQNFPISAAIPREMLKESVVISEDKKNIDIRFSFCFAGYTTGCYYDYRRDNELHTSTWYTNESRYSTLYTSGLSQEKLDMAKEYLYNSTLEYMKSYHPENTVSLDDMRLSCGYDDEHLYIQSQLWVSVMEEQPYGIMREKVFVVLSRVIITPNGDDFELEPISTTEWILEDG